MCYTLPVSASKFIYTYTHTHTHILSFHCQYQYKPCVLLCFSFVQVGMSRLVSAYPRHIFGGLSQEDAGHYMYLNNFNLTYDQQISKFFPIYVN